MSALSRALSYSLRTSYINLPVACLQCILTPNLHVLSPHTPFRPPRRQLVTGKGMSEVEKAQAAAVFKDDEPATFFDKIIAGEVPTTIVYEDDEALAFRDISPQVRT